MISLKDLENSSAYIISNSIEEDQDILEFLESYGYKTSFNTGWYDRARDNYIRIYFGLTKDQLIYVNTDNWVVCYHLNEIQEYNQKSDNLSIGDRVFIDTSKYPEIEGRIGMVKKIDNYKGRITYRVDISDCNNSKSADGLYLFNETQIARLETKADKEAMLTACDDVVTKPGYNTPGFKELYDKENIMKLLEIYRDRKMDKLFEDADKAQDKAWEKNSTYKTLKDLSEKTKTKDGYLFTFNFDIMPDSVREEINKIQKDKEEKEVQLNRLINEVNAQLQECETYEQKINILKAYEILDEKGKVNA